MGGNIIYYLSSSMQQAGKFKKKPSSSSSPSVQLSISLSKQKKSNKSQRQTQRIIKQLQKGYSKNFSGNFYLVNFSKMFFEIAPQMKNVLFNNRFKFRLCVQDYEITKNITQQLLKEISSKPSETISSSTPQIKKDFKCINTYEKQQVKDVIDFIFKIMTKFKENKNSKEPMEQQDGNSSQNTNSKGPKEQQDGNQSQNTNPLNKKTTLHGDFDIIFKLQQNYQQQRQIVNKLKQRARENLLDPDSGKFWFIQNYLDINVSQEKLQNTINVFQLKKNPFQEDQSSKDRLQRFLLDNKLINQQLRTEGQKKQKQKQDQKKKNKYLLQFVEKARRHNMLDLISQIIKIVLAVVANDYDQKKQDLSFQFKDLIRMRKDNKFDTYKTLRQEERSHPFIIFYFVLNSNVKEEQFRNRFDYFKPLLKHLFRSYQAMMRVIGYSKQDPIQKIQTVNSQLSQRLKMQQKQVIQLKVNQQKQAIAHKKEIQQLKRIINQMKLYSESKTGLESEKIRVARDDQTKHETKTDLEPKKTTEEQIKSISQPEKILQDKIQKSPKID